MRVWLILLGGMIVWFAHFMTLYAIGSVFIAGDTARALVGIFTAFALAGNLILLFASLRLIRAADQSRRTAGSLGAMGAALSILAVIWQALPAALS